MSKRKRKFLYLLFKTLSVAVSCGLPILAVCEHFPIWKEACGTARSVGAGGIIILAVIAVVFRKTVFVFLRDKLDLRHAPPLAVWLFLLAGSYALLYVSAFLSDLTTVLWFGLVGCALGTVLTYVAERFGKTGDH